jgi:hypothetical protein
VNTELLPAPPGHGPVCVRYEVLIKTGGAVPTALVVQSDLAFLYPILPCQDLVVQMFSWQLLFYQVGRTYLPVMQRCGNAPEQTQNCKMVKTQT